MQKQIETLEWENSGYYEQLVSVLQAISTIRKGKKRREATKPESRGSKLKVLEDSIANLDNQQSRAVIETVEGVQRIRGLAGFVTNLSKWISRTKLISGGYIIKIFYIVGSTKGIIHTITFSTTWCTPRMNNMNIIPIWFIAGLFKTCIGYCTCIRFRNI